MPIIGMTDELSRKPAFKELGTLNKGGEKSKNKMGKDLDHFRANLIDPEAMQAFNSFYGDNPKSIHIGLFHETVDDAFPTWWSAFNTAGLVVKSDGEYDYRWQEGSRVVNGKRPHIYTEGDNGKRYFEHNGKRLELKMSGVLEFFIMELAHAEFGGTVKLSTHSINDIVHINNVLHTVQKGRGSLWGAEFVMERVMRNIGTPGFGNTAGNRTRTDKWLVELKPSTQVFKAMLASGVKPQHQLSGSTTPQLEAGKKELPAPRSHYTTEQLQKWLHNHGLVEEQDAIDILISCGLSFDDWPAKSDKPTWKQYNDTIKEYINGNQQPTIDTSTGEVVEGEVVEDGF